MADDTQLESALKTKLPAPGSIIVPIKHFMRAWENFERRGTIGLTVEPDTTMCTVVSSWYVGNQARIIVLINGNVHMFSHKANNVWLNWKPI